MNVLPHVILFVVGAMLSVSCTGLNDVMNDYNNQRRRQHAEAIYYERMYQRPVELVDDGIPETFVSS